MKEAGPNKTPREENTHVEETVGDDNMVTENGVYGVA
jgi:hypothetical protein